MFSGDSKGKTFTDTVCRDVDHVIFLTSHLALLPNVVVSNLEEEFQNLEDHFILPSEQGRTPPQWKELPHNYISLRKILEYCRGRRKL